MSNDYFGCPHNSPDSSFISKTDESKTTTEESSATIAALRAEQTSFASEASTLATRISSAEDGISEIETTTEESSDTIAALQVEQASLVFELASLADRATFTEEEIVQLKTKAELAARVSTIELSRVDMVLETKAVVAWAKDRFLDYVKLGETVIIRNHVTDLYLNQNGTPNNTSESTNVHYSIEANP